MALTLDNMVAQMRALDMPDISPDELKVGTGRWERYGEGKRAYYRIDRRVSRNGNEYYVGVFGYKGNGPHLFEYEGPRLTDEERRKLERDRAETARREARARAREVQHAADNAAETWREATLAGQSPYLLRKQIGELSGTGWIRFRGPNVVVPMVRFDLPAGDRLRGVQIIRPDGEKRFTSGMEKTGSAAVLGHHQVGEPILIAEGLATAASCWLALGRRYRVVVAFDAGSLLPVAEVFRKLFADAPLGILADDDWLTPLNPGIFKALRASKNVGLSQIVRPRFAERRDAKWTDFNDLHLAEGLDAVREQLGRFVAFLRTL